MLVVSVSGIRRCCTVWRGCLVCKDKWKAEVGIRHRRRASSRSLAPFFSYLRLPFSTSQVSPSTVFRKTPYIVPPSRLLQIPYSVNLTPVSHLLNVLGDLPTATTGLPRSEQHQWTTIRANSSPLYYDQILSPCSPSSPSPPLSSPRGYLGTLH